MQKLCFLDLETTGFEPTKDSIIEISFITTQNGQEINRFDQVIIPDKSKLSEFISNLTGITQEEIDTQGWNLNEHKTDILKKIGEAVIIGHNIDFDINFLIENGIDVSKNDRIDTHELARIILPKEDSFALEVLSQKYGFVHENAHRAMSDVEASENLFNFLLDKINKLPTDFLAQIKPVLETKTNWYAKSLFLESQGNADFSFERKKEPISEISYDIPDKLKQKINSIHQDIPILWRIGNSVPSAQAITKTALEISNQKQVLIITPKLKFYPGIKQFPIPEVLLDSKRLNQFANDRVELDNQEITFYLKCTFRHFLGYRGIDDFDISYQENHLWKEVQIIEDDNPIFQKIITEREAESVMTITPNAFFRFHDLSLFRDRFLIIDEAEIFTELLLHFPAKTVSLTPYLNSKDETQADKTLFYIKNFCRDVIEEKLQHSITPFPARILFENKDLYPSEAQRLRELNPEDKDLDQAAKYLEDAESNVIRWSIYYPDNGNLSFSTWKFEDWKKLKESLKLFPKILCHRHNIEKSNDFFKTFLGIKEHEIFMDHKLLMKQKLIVPPNMTSSNSPDYNQFCGQRILDIIQKDLKEGGCLLANFSSIETLKNVHTQIMEGIKKTDIKVFGERATGGEGKNMEMMKKHSQFVFCNQKMIHPELEKYDWQTIVIQKYPFPAPSPLMEAVENSMKTNGKNYFKSWIIPQVSANLSRRTSVFSNASKIVFLDPRENTKWGKEVLRRAFET